MAKGKVFELSEKHYSYGVADNYNRRVKRVSRWIRIDYILVTEKHSLYDYADHSDPWEGKSCLCCFRYNNRLYALGQFERLCYPYSFIDTDGGTTFIGGYDYTDYYNPLLIEVHADGEAVRLYQELTETECGKLFS